MTKALVHHARRHTISYLALSCSLLALGGAASAALQIPFGSVGERQLRNYAIDPVKWDPNYVTGFVRRWATISSSGSIMSTSPGGQSKSIGTGDVVVTWGDAFAHWCAPIATVLGGSATPTTTTTDHLDHHLDHHLVDHHLPPADAHRRGVRRCVNRDQERRVDPARSGDLQLARSASRRTGLSRGHLRSGRRVGPVVPDQSAVSRRRGTCYGQATGPNRRRSCVALRDRPAPVGCRIGVTRVLVVSWEYPPVIEGGLGRHVRKLSEHLVRDGVEVHVLTRGGSRLPVHEERHGVFVHRVREPAFPMDLSAFVRWADAMNDDLQALGTELCERFEFDLVHSHDWLVAGAAERVARGLRRPWLTTVHATEYGRHQGWVRRLPPITHPRRRACNGPAS